MQRLPEAWEPGRVLLLLSLSVGQRVHSFRTSSVIVRYPSTTSLFLGWFFTRAYFSCVVNSHGCLFPLPPWMRPTLATERFERKIEVVQVQWYFTSTEPILKSIRDEEPWTATSTFTQLLSSSTRVGSHSSGYNYDTVICIAAMAIQVSFMSYLGFLCFCPHSDHFSKKAEFFHSPNCVAQEDEALKQ